VFGEKAIDVLKDELDRSEPELSSDIERARLDAAIVDECSVSAAKVTNTDFAILDGDLGVAARDTVEGNNQFTFGAVASDDERSFLKPEGEMSDFQSRTDECQRGKILSHGQSPVKNAAIPYKNLSRSFEISLFR
jgi:hypothetical protein